MTDYSPARAPTSTSSGTPRRGALSLEHKLPLLMTAVLAAVLGASLLLTYRTLARGAEDAAQTWLRGAAQQLALSAEQGTSTRARLMRRVASAEPVRAALRGENVAPAAVDAMLDSLRTPADSGLALELWSAEGRRVHVSHGELPPRGVAPALASPEPGIAAPARGLLRPDSVHLGAFEVVDGRIFFWATTPVTSGGRILGYVRQRRRVGEASARPDSARDASRILRGLTGNEVVVFLRNADDSLWLSSQGFTAAPPAMRDTAHGRLVHQRAGGRYLAVVTAIPGTPWGVVLETPLDAVHARARTTVQRLAVVSFALMLAGTLLAWLLGRRIAKPITSLTVAAEAIARGDYSGRVEVRRRDEVGRLAASFNAMAGEIDHGRQQLVGRMEDADRARDEAQTANRAKSDFLATMSHELRTPLNAIGGYAELLELGIYGDVTAAQRDALSRITRNQAHLLRLINDVLHFAKLSVGQLPYAIGPVPLDPALAELDILVAPQVSAKRLQYSHAPCTDEIVVRADREKLQQVVLNLLSNAIKFTPERGRIVVACERVDGVARVHVRDTGIGIPASRLASVFDAFVQVDRALNRPNEGVGLGLAISRDLAVAMGGDLTVTSEVDVGSTFTLTLPLWQSSDARLPTPPAGMTSVARR